MNWVNITNLILAIVGIALISWVALIHRGLSKIHYLATAVATVLCLFEIGLALDEYLLISDYLIKVAHSLALALVIAIRIGLSLISTLGFAHSYRSLETKGTRLVVALCAIFPTVILIENVVYVIWAWQFLKWVTVHA